MIPQVLTWILSAMPMIFVRHQPLSVNVEQTYIEKVARWTTEESIDDQPLSVNVEHILRRLPDGPLKSLQMTLRRIVHLGYQKCYSKLLKDEPQQEVPTVNENIESSDENHKIPSSNHYDVKSLTPPP